MSQEHEPIRAEMTVLEVLHRYRQTEAVFRRYEQDAKGCLLCQALFDTLAEAAAKHGLDLDRLVGDLQACAAGSTDQAG
ncbi:MAG: hypothetical protein ACUVXF_06450 [Desulfobaccales bacterium]